VIKQNLCRFGFKNRFVQGIDEVCNNDVGSAGQSEGRTVAGEGGIFGEGANDQSPISSVSYDRFALLPVT